MEAGKSKTCSVGWLARDPEEPMVQFQSEGSLLEIFLLLWEAGPSTDWMRPTHIMEGNLLTQSSLI